LSFNPCYNGLLIRTLENEILKNQIEQCFNPCYNGLLIRTLEQLKQIIQEKEFQSLL